MCSQLSTFQCVRSRVANFCNARDWATFHTPVNLALALAGECGEVCEVFQWKGPLDAADIALGKFSERELVNIGEEIADVFIYSTRLSDVCDIDLASSINSYIHGSDGSCKRSDSTSCWIELDLDFSIVNKCGKKHSKYPSPRHTVLSLVESTGKLCSIFQERSESDCQPGLSQWSEESIIELSGILAEICILLKVLSQYTKISLSKVISDKFAKNDKKYPADIVRGSSAKYTEYKQYNQSSIESRSVSDRFIGKNLVLLSIGLVIGFLIAKKC